MAAMIGKKPIFPSAPTKPTPPQAPVQAPKPTTSLLATEDIARRVAEAKKRVAEAQSRMSLKDNPYLVRFISISGLIPV